jgi:glyoxylase-like metal-dependent hydrolase (beta-lactamase superfamily II)
MQSIADNVYLEDQYPGVTLGVICQPHGLIQIDAPPSPEDGRAWRASLLNLNGGPERVLVNLDSHPDRTLGVRAMDCTVIAHEKTAQAFRNRPTTFKAQGDETGAEWEKIAGIGNVRWAPPEISFSESMSLEWGGMPIRLEHRPGPTTGAIWVTLPEERVVFVGDAVIKAQPPYLAHAGLPEWMNSLDQLLGDQYRGYSVISGRGGAVAVATIRSMRDWLAQLYEQIEKLAQKQAAPEATETLIPALLSGFKAAASLQAQYARRLRYGLYRYYVRHYRPSSSDMEE